MDDLQLDRLLAEFKRVGVDPDTLSAGLAVKSDDALRLLGELPDDAGPEAFLSQLRTHAARLSPPGGVPRATAE
ncbi:MAG: hypothetical protein JWO05_1597 [Gemmatimonadetes bacterium]|nr:hypothetical protein [Gemmatimonadota bacterium]